MAARAIGSLTDRAKRYRANSPAVRPPMNNCGYCGNAGRLDVEHIDGDEANADPWNLIAACRPCNTVKGIVLQAAGMGRRTRQFNPAPRRRAVKALPEYRRNVAILLGRAPGSVPAAVASLQATAPGVRARLAAQLAGRVNPSAEFWVRGVKVPFRSVEDARAAAIALAVKKRVGAVAIWRRPAGGGPMVQVETLTARDYQGNPSKRRGGPSFNQWAGAIAAYGGGDQMSLFDPESARAVLHDAKSAGKVSEFQRQVWRIRKERYGPSGRKGFDDVPF